MYIELSTQQAAVLAQLLNDNAATAKARNSISFGEAPSPPDEAELEELLQNLQSDEDQDEPLTREDLAGPVQPTAQQKLVAQNSRNAERIHYARAGQPITFGRRHCTETESELAMDMVRRQPGLSFTTALALLRRGTSG